MSGPIYFCHYIGQRPAAGLRPGGVGSHQGGQAGGTGPTVPPLPGDQRRAGAERQPEGGEAADPQHGVRDDPTPPGLCHQAAQERRKALR